MKVSVIVSTTNLLNNIDRVISSFSSQELLDDYEVIIENDLVEEDRSEILEKLGDNTQFKLLNDDKSGKSFISLAIQNSAGEHIVLVTDEYDYPINYLSKIISVFEQQETISALIGDVKIDHLFEIGEYGKFLEELNFKSMKSLIGLENSSKIDSSVVNYGDLLLIDNLAIKKNWFLEVYENYSKDHLDVNTLIKKIKLEGELYYSSDLIANFMVTEDFTMFNYMKTLGLLTGANYFATKDDKFECIFPVPFTLKQFKKVFSFGLSGSVVFSSFFVAHIFLTLFMIDMIFFSGLFSSLSPWIFLLLSIISFLVSFRSILNVNEEIDKLELVKFKYVANVAFYFGLFKKMIKHKIITICKPIV